MKYSLETLESDFPVLSKQINNNRLVYLDNAATSLTPKQVVQSIVDYYENYNANVHRGIHKMSEEATLLYEESHKKVARFINASPEEIVFTKNTTESLNIVAHGLCADLTSNDNVVITEMEHHSNFVPWQHLSKIKGFELRFIPINDQGKLDSNIMKTLIDDNTKVVSITHASNVLGTINPVEQIGKLAHEKNALLVVDAAQTAPHMKLDMKKLNPDFLAFSSHKMMGPTGIGILYGKKHLLEKLSPLMFGGDMIKEVTFTNTTYNDLPYKFEPGTPNIADGIAFGVAIDYLERIGMHNILQHSQLLAKKTIEMLTKLGIEVYGPAYNERVGVVSFNVPGIHPHDVCSILDELGIAIRGGHNCAMPLHTKLGITASCRASFNIYNNEQDVLDLINGLKKVLKVFKK